MPNSCTPATCGPGDSRPEIPDDQLLAEVSKALGHPARVQILRLLLRHQRCICGDIVDALPLAQSTVSQHLKQMKQAGLIQGEVEGVSVCYCLNPAVLRRFKAIIAEL
jgi:DNA-binding transcriptional ArsR family regulator